MQITEISLNKDKDGNLYTSTIVKNDDGTYSTLKGKIISVNEVDTDLLTIATNCVIKDETHE